MLVAVGEQAATVQDFFAHNPLPGGARVTLDLDGDTMRRWGVRTFPTTFVVDRAGVVRHINRGWGARLPGAPAPRWLHAMLGDAAKKKERPSSR